MRHAHTQFAELKQSSGPDMAEMLELSYRGFKINMVNILKTLMEKVDRM